MLFPRGSLPKLGVGNCWLLLVIVEFLVLLLLTVSIRCLWKGKFLHGLFSFVGYCWSRWVKKREECRCWMYNVLVGWYLFTAVGSCINSSVLLFVGYVPGRSCLPPASLLLGAEESTPRAASYWVLVKSRHWINSLLTLYYWRVEVNEWKLEPLLWSVRIASVRWYSSETLIHSMLE